MKRILAILLAICMLLSLCGCANNDRAADDGESAVTQSKESEHEEDEDTSAPATIEGKGFKSAEKAALAYAEALRSGDVQKILSTFAMETYVDCLNMKEYLYSTGYYSYSMGLVSSDDYSRQIRLIQRQNELATLLGYLYTNYTEFGFGDNMAPVSVPPSSYNPYETIDEMIDAMSVENWDEILSQMEIGEVLTLGEVLPDYDTEVFSEHMEKMTKRYGCEEQVPLAVEVTLDGVDYYLCVDVVNYDGTWYNLSMIGTIGTIMGVSRTSCGLVPR